MSHSFRQPVGAQPSVPVAQTPLPGRMVAPICTTGTPAVFPVMPNAYGLISHPPQPYIAQPVVYPQPVPNVQNKVPFVAAVRPNVPRMFVPVATVPPGMSPVAVADPTKLFEEQKRLEKERNFQLQQERLKQFTVAGKKSGINADNLIDSMFGKLQPKKTPPTSQSHHSTKINERNVEKRVQNIAFDVQKLQNSEPPDIKPNFPSNFSTTSHTSIPDKRELDSMMLECSSNLNAPSKAAKFQKPSVKETTPSSSHGTTFASSERARDWRNVQGLDQVFTIPKPRFPSWCHKDKVPEMFKKVQAIVTNNDMHAPDTNLLFPILMSSGLSREILGQIWELVNESASGQLTVEEMFAALALIAVVQQAGLPVKSVDILHQVPSCPIPQLSFFSSATPSLDENKSTPLVAEASPVVETSHPEQHPVHQVVRPTAISLASNLTSDLKEVTNVTENIASWTPFTGSSNTADDDFDDFKSATPTAINFSLATPSSQAPPTVDDDFDDFKQAPCMKTTNESFPISETSKIPQESAAVQEDLMSPEEDKYSVFRSLQQNEESSHWGDFTFSSISNNSNSTVVSSSRETDNKENFVSPFPSLLITESTDGPGLFKNACTVEGGKNIQEEDEFGDFIHAGPPAHESNASSDFADFSNFKSAESEQFSAVTVDDEFGEFTSSVSMSLKPESGQDFLFRHLKDNISLAESQSVSSLELGTFDGGGNHSGESKSSLSRQGSIPSLDLKGVGLDGTDTEDCLGEIHLSSFVPRNSKSPSPVSNNKGSDENDTITTSVGLVFQTPGLSLTDKYSVIRQEKAKDEDQHVSCWIQCLQSAVDILQSTKKMFNQMSCSSVCNEVLTSEEGENYVKNVIEVYKVICRIGVSSRAVSKQTGAILDLLNEADQVWNTVTGFFAGSVLMPEESSLNFSSGVLRSEPENNPKACGLCLLNIELRSKSFRQEECPKLSYGGRNYHSTCANFWVNCVDPLLPALVLPQLL